MGKLKKLALENSDIFWDVASIEELSDIAILERMINYADWQNFTQIFSTLNASEFKEMFDSIVNKKRSNLRPEAANLAKVYSKNYYAN